MTRENATLKAHRLLVEGRLTVRSVDGDYVHATCRGDTAGLYDLGHDPTLGEWRCTCPAKGRCSHLIALQLVVVL